MGSRGRGLSHVSTRSSRLFKVLATRNRPLRATRPNPPGREDDRSSFEVEGVSGGVGGKEGASVMVTWRTSDMEIVASAAISLAMLAERGVVVKTTKYGIEEARGNVTEVGKVTYGTTDGITV